MMCNDNMPLRAGGKRFDHLPVSLTITIYCLAHKKMSDDSGHKSKCEKVKALWYISGIRHT